MLLIELNEVSLNDNLIGKVGIEVLTFLRSNGLTGLFKEDMAKGSLLQASIFRSRSLLEVLMVSHDVSSSTRTLYFRPHRKNAGSMNFLPQSPPCIDDSSLLSFIDDKTRR